MDRRGAPHEQPLPPGPWTARNLRPPPHHNSHERFTKFEQTMPIGIRLPRLQYTPAEHKARSLVTLPAHPLGHPGPGAPLQHTLQGPPDFERQEAIEHMWSCADKIMRDAVTRRARRKNHPPEPQLHAQEKERFRCREPAVLMQPQSAARLQLCTPGTTLQGGKQPLVTVPQAAAPRRSRPERIYLGVHPSQLTEKTEIIISGANGTAGFVAVDNVNHKKTKESRHMQTVLLGRNLEVLQENMEKQRNAKCCKVRNMDCVSGLCEWAVWWRCVVALCGGAVWWRCVSAFRC